MEVKGISISPEMLNDWAKKVLPYFDLLFFTDENKSFINHLDSNVLVMSARDFYRDTYFNDFDTLNSYQAWQITNDVSHVCIVHPDNLLTLESDIREKMFRVQKEINSGLVFKWDLIAKQIENSKSLLDRKSTRLNSSHVAISYAVFCLKKKNKYYSRTSYSFQD